LKLLLALDSMLTDLFLEKRAGLVYGWLELVLLLHDFAHMKDELFFDRIRIFANFERGWHELVFSQLHAQSFS